MASTSPLVSACDACVGVRDGLEDDLVDVGRRPSSSPVRRERVNSRRLSSTSLNGPEPIISRFWNSIGSSTVLPDVLGQDVHEDDVGLEVAERLLGRQDHRRALGRLDRRRTRCAYDGRYGKSGVSLVQLDRERHVLGGQRRRRRGRPRRRRMVMVQVRPSSDTSQSVASSGDELAGDVDRDRRVVDELVQRVRLRQQRRSRD